MDDLEREIAKKIKAAEGTVEYWREWAEIAEGEVKARDAEIEKLRGELKDIAVMLEMAEECDVAYLDGIAERIRKTLEGSA